MIEIWGKTACPYCVKAKQFCETRNLDYTYKQLDVDFTRDEVFENFPNARTFPQIKISGKIIGGFDDMMTYIETTGYNGTGYSL